jgi:RHS repeat-associated protein
MTAVGSKKGGSTLFSAGYMRDAANQLTSDNSAASGTGSYKYTPLNQVCYAGSSSSSVCGSPPSGSIAYKYDAADNLIQTGSIQQTFNTADELCWTASTSGSCASPPTGATTYSYDTRGNRTAVTPSAGQAQTLSYDQANRLTSYAAASTTTYAYNADGLRMSKTSGGTTTQYVWNVAGGLPLLLKDDTTSYIYGPGGLALEQIAGSTISFMHHDQIGSTRLITNSAGSSVETYRYDSYGNLVASTGTITNRLRFAGQYQDGESSLYYLRARYYDTATGQFISVDPAVRSTRAPYRYTAGNPLKQIDPSGLATAGLSLGVQVGPLNVGWSGCVVADTHGNYGATLTRGYGGGCCFSASLTGGVQVSNADTIYDLSGPFAEGGGCAGEGGVVCDSGFRGTDHCGRDVWGGYLGGGFGAGVPWEGHVGGTNTRVFPWGGPGPTPCYELTPQDGPITGPGGPIFASAIPAGSSIDAMLADWACM